MRIKLLGAALVLAGGIGCGAPMTAEEEQAAFEADSLEQPIARGTAVPNGGFPWAVSLHTSATPSSGNTLCSGSHVAPGWVLTAQHCFDHNLDGVISAAELSATEVWASLDRTRISDTTRGEVIQGAQVYLNNTNDMALLRLSHYSRAPIVQLGSAAPAVNTALTAAGWGFVNSANTLPNNLQQGQFKVAGSNALDLLYLNVNTEEMCGGDSGGPIFTQSGGTVKVVAVHTNSPGGCGVNVGNATGSRVDVALPWIRSIVRSQYGFVWAEQPATASYTPSAGYAYNSTGGANTVTRLGTGAYRVDMDGLGQSNGNVQVTSYGTTSRCKVSSWGALGTQLQVQVRCFSPAGAAADARFVAQYYRAGAGIAQQDAYLWAEQPNTASYAPSRFYSFNSRGGVNRVSRSAVGVYTATLPGFTSIGGNVQVTAYGATADVCKVTSWGVSTVHIACFNAAGAPVDTRFSLRTTDHHVANAFRRGAYAWANDPLAASYTPSATYQWHSGGQSLTATRAGTGQYAITLPNLAASNKTSAMVTAYGAGNASCNVASWLPSGTSTVVSVRCYTPAGALSDAQFTLSYLTNL